MHSEAKENPYRQKDLLSGEVKIFHRCCNCWPHQCDTIAAPAMETNCQSTVILSWLHAEKNHWGAEHKRTNMDLWGLERWELQWDPQWENIIPPGHIFTKCKQPSIWKSPLPSYKVLITYHSYLGYADLIQLANQKLHNTFYQNLDRKVLQKTQNGRVSYIIMKGKKCRFSEKVRCLLFCISWS